MRADQSLHFLSLFPPETGREFVLVTYDAALMIVATLDDDKHMSFSLEIMDGDIAQAVFFSRPAADNMASRWNRTFDGLTKTVTVMHYQTVLLTVITECEKSLHDLEPHGH